MAKQLRSKRTQRGNGNRIEALEQRFLMASGLPSTPTNFKAAPLNTSSLRLSWNDAARETNYVIEKYNGLRFVGQTPTLAANTITYDVGSLSAGTTYTFRIRATNSRGNSTSNSSSATTTVVTPAPPTVATPVLINDSALPMTHRVNLHWENVSGVSKWILQRQNGSAWQDVFNGTKAYNANGYNFIDAGLNEKTTYNYRLFAVDGSGLQSAASTTLFASTGGARVLHSSTASGALPDPGIVEANVRDASYFLLDPNGGPVDPVRAAQTAHNAMGPNHTPGRLIIDVECWDNSATTVQYLKDLITTIRTAEPNIELGIFEPAYIDFHPTINGQRMRGLDFVSPSLFTSVDNIPAWWNSAEQTVAEANTAGLPVYPFLWPRYFEIAFTGSPVLEQDFWKAQQAQMSQIADGYVIWGDDPAIRPTLTFSPPWWIETQQFMNDLAVTNPQAPAAPTNLGVDSGKSRITWIDASTNEAVFVIDRAEFVNGTWSAYDTVGVVDGSANSGSARTFTDSRLNSGRTYRYRVGALSNRGKITWVEAAPQSPSGRSAFDRIHADFYDRAQNNAWKHNGTALTTNTLKVWYEYDNIDFNDAQGNPATQVVLRQASQFDVPVTIELVVDATIDAVTNQPVGGTVIGSFSAIRTADNTYLLEQRNAITAPTPVNGKNVHNLFVRFIAATGQWPAQRLDWLRFDNGPTATPFFTPTQRTSNTITLNWSNVSAAALHHDNLDAAGFSIPGEIDGYDIYYSTTADFAMNTTNHVSAAGSATSAVVSGLLANTTYYFRLVANDTYRTPKTGTAFPQGYAWNVATVSAATT